MKTRNLLAALALLLAPVQLGADGLPYDENRVTRPFVGLRISEEQVKEISATGLVTFDEGNLKLLRRFYPQFPRKAAVASSTFNDNLERDDGDCPDVIWWFANEIRVILIDPDKAETLSIGEEPAAWSFPLLRLSPKAEIFHQGRTIGFSRALEIIESEAAKTLPDQDYRIVLPPPYPSKWEVAFDLSKLDPAVRSLLPEELDIEKQDFNFLVRTLFDRLVAHGKGHGMMIHKSW